MRCATDVTGYGLLGHLREVVQASGVSARINAEAVPVLDGIAELIDDGVFPGGSKRNLESVGSIVDSSVGETTLKILADAQTSGGLLMAVDPDSVKAVVAGLAGKAPVAAVIGEIVAVSGEPGISVA